MHAFRSYIFAARIACDSGPTCYIIFVSKISIILVFRFRKRILIISVFVFINVTEITLIGIIIHVHIYLNKFGTKWHQNHQSHLKGVIAMRVVSGILCWLNWTFFARCYVWCATSGSKSAISLQRGPVDPKFNVEGSPPPSIFFLEN